MRADAAAVVAIDARHDVGLPGRDCQRRVLQRQARLAPATLDDVDEAWIADAQHVAHAGVVRDAADQHAVDIALGQPAILQRRHEGLRPQLVGAALRVEVAIQRAEGGVPHPGDGDLVFDLQRCHYLIA
jgi:hypothetical protein